MFWFHVAAYAATFGAGVFVGYKYVTAFFTKVTAVETAIKS